jgi:two-component system, LytTR family, response regulator
MMRLRTLIVEDSRLARAELRRLLDNHPEVEVVGEAANADEAELFIPDLQPDLLLLDIQMPGRNGFELLEALDSVPLVIFTTAYSEFAVQAFEKNALDYLVKPVQAERLAKALQKAEQAASQLGLDQPGANQREPREGDVEAGPGRNLLKGTDRVFVKDGEHCWFVPLAEVRLLEVEGNYTRLYFGTHQPLVPKTLNYLESRLDPQIFFRASRQHLVNLNWVKDVEPWFSGSLRLMLRSGQQVEVSRRQAQRFRDLMSL